MNYIKQLQDKVAKLTAERDALSKGIADLRGYLFSEKFHTDTTVQTRDIDARLIAIVNDGGNAYTAARHIERPRFEKFVLPCYWASYLINGDASGLSEAEKDQCDVACKRLGIADACDCGEQYFARTNDAGTLAGDVCEFTCRLR